jgi:hypothetical protein
VQKVVQEAHGLGAEAETDQVHDEEQDRRGHGPHADAHEGLGQREDGPQPHRAEQCPGHREQQRLVGIRPEEQQGHEGQTQHTGGGGNPHAEAGVAGAEGVDEAPPQVGTRGARDPRDQAQPGADLAGPHAVHPDQERGGPVRHAVAREGGEGRRQGDVAEAAQAPQEAEHLSGRRHVAARLPSFRQASRRLAHGEAHEDREGDAGQADHEESGPPVEGLVDPAAGEVAEGDADVDAGGVDRERGRAPVRGEVVREQRVRRRAARRLADSDADPRQRELREALGQPRGRRHRAPERRTDGDDAAPRPAVGEARDRDAREGVEHRERGSGQESHRGVGDTEVSLDGLEEDREDLAVDEVEDVDDEQQAEHVARVAGGHRRLGPRRLGGGSSHAALRSRDSRGCARGAAGGPGRRSCP